MADGIPFVPLDCHFDDDKIPMIEAEFGLEGFAIIVKLYQKIYGGLGYYCEWNDRTALLFARQIGADSATLRSVVAAAVREGIFDGEMLEKFGILTSHGIQKRFMNVAKRRRQVFSRPEYVLECFAGNDAAPPVVIEEVNAYIEDETAYIPPTSKVKESEVNITEEKESECTAASPPASPSPSNPREELISRYGSAAVDNYEQRYHAWQEKSGRTGGNMYASISRWMEQDGVHKDESMKSSFEMEDIMARLRNKYAK